MRTKLEEADLTIAEVKAFDHTEAVLLEDEKKFLEIRDQVVKELEQEPKPEARAEAIATAVKLSYEMLPARPSITDQVKSSDPKGLAQLFLAACEKAGWNKDQVSKLASEKPKEFEALFHDWMMAVGKTFPATYAETPILPVDEILTNDVSMYAQYTGKLGDDEEKPDLETEPKELNISPKVKPVEPGKKRRILG